MKVFSVPALLVVLLSPLGAQAADISPGLWAITMETRTSAAPGFQPAPVTVNQCFTAADARDPSAILGGTPTEFQNKISAKRAGNC